MRNVITAAMFTLCCFSIVAGGCRKNKEEARLFADRHWHYSRTATTTCYDLATNGQTSKKTIDTAYETVFAIKDLGNGEIEFQGLHMSRYEPDDTVDKYIHSGGHGPGARSSMLFYSRSRNVIYSNESYEVTVTDTVQQTTCETEGKTSWISSN
jgi:hypothetical protein